MTIKRIIIRWNEYHESSIKRAERNKTRLENDGYKLVDSKGTFSRGKLVYEKEV
jgi:hypothetical protein